jgi:hypothetical protein
MTYELPVAPLSIGGVLDSAIRLYRDSMRRTWILALLYSAILGIFGIAWALTLTKAGVAGTKDPRVLLAAMFAPNVIAGLLVSIVLSLVFYGALMKAMCAWAKGDTSLSIGSAIVIGARRFPGVLLGFVLNMLIIAAGVVLLLIPGVFFMGKLQLWMPAMFMEDAGGVEAIGVSWRLTRSRWWRGAAILTVALILVYVFAVALGFVAAFIGRLAHLALLESTIVNQLFGMVSNLIVLPLFVAILIVMYHDFKLRSEGGDLAARVGSLNKA